MKQLVFHIGDPKTGSTSLQHAFAAGAIEFASQSVFYPTKKGRLAHNYLVDHIKTAVEAAREGRKKAEVSVLKQLARKVRTSDADAGVISGELFHGFDGGDFKEVVGRYFDGIADTVKVVAYVRPHASRILSSYSEGIKIGVRQDDLDSFVLKTKRNRLFSYTERFGRWREAFGENFVLRPMVRSELYQQSVVHDFVRFGLGYTDFSVKEAEEANISLGLEQLALLRLLQGRLAEQPYPLRHTVGWEIARLFGDLGAGGAKTRLQLHRGAAERIREYFLEDARATDRMFFGDSGILEQELEQSIAKAIPEAQSLAPEDCFSGTELANLRVMIELVAELLGNESGAGWRSYLRKFYLDTVMEQEQKGSDPA